MILQRVCKYKKTKRRNLRFFAIAGKCAEVSEKRGVKFENRAGAEKSVRKLLKTGCGENDAEESEAG